jgi:DNA-binding MarR family transcriptional regulator
METDEKLQFIKTHDPDGAARLERLIGKKDALKEGNVYGERFTDRQFSLVFNPLLDTTFERARILEVLSQNAGTVPGLSEKLGIGKDRVFTHIKEMMRKNLVEIAGHEGRDPLFRGKRA